MSDLPYVETDETRANQALLVGMIAGVLSAQSEHFPHVAMEDDGHGNYTGRILVERPSGTWVLTVEKQA